MLARRKKLLGGRDRELTLAGGIRAVSKQHSKFRTNLHRVKKKPKTQLEKQRRLTDKASGQEEL